MKNFACFAFPVFLFLLPLESRGTAPISFHSYISGRISVPGEVDEYIFEANAGDTIIIRTFSEDIFLDAKISLFWMADNAPIEPQFIIINLSGIISVEHVLSQEGAVGIRYFDQTRKKTGAYVLDFQRLKTPSVQVGKASHSCSPALSLSVFPNPTVESATISFDLPYTQKARLDILDLRGAVVINLANGLLPAGYQSFVWRPWGLPAGVYICRLVLENEVFSKKVHFSP
ncbi:MAG: T9SS type A sorting domain-containing protein [Saprospirales bacterium]|nr:T9SS type A sorting domain-containing protein [Saprospirales bacterium]